VENEKPAVAVVDNVCAAGCAMQLGTTSRDEYTEVFVMSKSKNRRSQDGCIPLRRRSSLPVMPRFQKSITLGV
jgi:hypothetical protein